MDIPTHSELVDRIDGFLARHRMAPSRFGRETTGEPNLVTSIRDGRSPNLDTLGKIASFMAAKDGELTTPPSPASANNGTEIIRSGETNGGAGTDEAGPEVPAPRPFGATCSSTISSPPDAAATPPATGPDPCSTGATAMPADRSAYPGQAA